MRRILFFVLMVLLSITMMANPVDPDKAIQVARNHVMSQVKMDNYNAMLVYTHPMPKTGESAFYVVNVGSSAFVLVAADDIAHPVLGYSMSRLWPTGNADGSSASSRDEQIALPSQITAFLDDLASQIEAARQQDIAPDRNIVSEWSLYLSGSSPMLEEGDPQGGGVCQTPSSSLPDSVGPLLTTTWDQGQYYNALCPEDANGPAGHTYTGCVATAMAQIINYWGYPLHGRGTHSFDAISDYGNYGPISVNFDSSVYDYANMPNALSSTNTPQEVNAVATLMRDCGVAADMDWGAGSSPANELSVRAAFLNHFKFSKDMVHVLKDNYSPELWDSLLQNEINNNRPVFYAASGYTGHAFICDGYNSNGFFHFNFGWSGGSDGWYLTNAITPGGNIFNSGQAVIMGIAPSTSDENVFLSQLKGNTSYELTGPTDLFHIAGNNSQSLPLGGSCNNVITFISTDTTKHLVVDFFNSSFLDITIYDGIVTDSVLRVFTRGGINDFSPVVTSKNKVTIVVDGYIYYEAGFHFHIEENGDCRLVSMLEGSVDSNSVRLNWTENGTSTQWQIEYGEFGHTCGSGTLQSADSVSCVVGGLIPYTQYDFYVRPTCRESWYGPITLTAESPKWPDAVATQPSGYNIDAQGRVLISTAEGLAWWAKTASANTNRDVILTADIDLNGRQWVPVDYYSGKIDGRGHVISSMNVYEPQGGGAFIKNYYNGEIIDLGIEHFSVFGWQGVSGIATGLYNARMKNCYTRNGHIVGMDNAGLVHFIDGGSSVRNCFAENINTEGPGYNGGIVGYSEGVIENCYSFFSPETCPLCQNGGIVGYSNNAVISNCYSNYIHPSESNFGIVVATTPALSSITDTSVFTIEDTLAILEDTVFFDTIACSDLLTALNQWVLFVGDTSYCTWIREGYGTLPVFGEKYTNDCPVVSNLMAINTEIDETPAVLLTWDGFSTYYEILCTPMFSSEDSTHHFISPTDSLVITDLTIGVTYKIKVRAICESNSKSGWGVGITHTPDKLYWHEVVLEQPADYRVDANGEYWISSAESLVWLVRTGYIENVIVHLERDINLGRYKWRPVYAWNMFFYGNNRKINNIYCREDGVTSLFSNLYDSDVNNLNISGNVYSISNAGGLFTGANNCTFNNCHSSVNIHTTSGESGSLGANAEGCTLTNCSSVGDVAGNADCGGLVGRVFNTTIKNCFSYGEMTVFPEIGWSHWHRGGLVGYISNSSVVNSYAARAIPIGDHGLQWIGTLLGYVCADVTVTNSYGLIDSIGLWVYDASNINNNICHDNTLFDSLGRLLDTVVVLGIPDTITVNGVAYEYLLNALNAWVDAYDTAGVCRHWTADTTGENGGYPVFAAIPCPVVDVHDTVAACENYTWNGSLYNSSIVVMDTLSTINGCDSIVTLHLTINNPVHTATTHAACDSYSWNNTNYTASGNYTYSHADVNGCTQVDTLHLTINNPVHTATTETACESYTWNGTAYTASGNYTYSHTDANGCTQVDTLHLTINTPIATDVYDTACDNYTWFGTTYTATGDYVRTGTSALPGGCDTTETLHLTINNPVHTATTETACESYTWNGTAYTASGNYTYSHTDANGCTQVDTLLLTINTPVVTDVYDTACESYTWFGTTYTTTGDYVRTGTSALPGGCDTTETLHLTINHSVTIFDTLSLLSNELPYNYHGNTINSEGDYTFNGTTIEGCDSTVILYVTVTPVGIFDIQNSEFKTDVFPNPTNGVVTIASEEVTRVEVMDASGRKVLTVENSNRIDLSNMPSGVYMLQITTLQGKALKRVIRK